MEAPCEYGCRVNHRENGILKDVRLVQVHLSFHVSSDNGQVRKVSYAGSTVELSVERVPSREAFSCQWTSTPRHPDDFLHGLVENPVVHLLMNNDVCVQAVDQRKLKYIGKSYGFLFNSQNMSRCLDFDQEYFN